MAPASLINVTYGERLEAKRRGTPLQARLPTKVNTAAEPPEDGQRLANKRVPFTPDMGFSPDFNRSGNDSRGLVDLRFHSPGKLSVFFKENKTSELRSKHSIKLYSVKIVAQFLLLILK